MAKVELVLPYPPSVNHAYIHARGRVFLSKKGHEYRAQVKALITGMNLQPVDTDVALFIQLYPPDNRRRDIDNVLKVLLDSLQHGGAFVDDSHVQLLHITKEKKSSCGGRVIVGIEII